MNLLRRGKRWLPDRIQTPLAMLLAVKHTSSADFMAYAVWSVRRFRTFNINDDFNCESPRIEIDTSLPSARVIQALDELIETRGNPQRLRLDNGPEFISQVRKDWTARHGVASISSRASRPRTPTSSALIGPFCTEVLDCYVVQNLNEVRRMAGLCRHRYNHHRPHRVLGGFRLYQVVSEERGHFNL